MIRKSRIDWSGFSKLRNEESNCIEAASCKLCKWIIHTVTDKRLQKHRESCKGLSSDATSVESSENKSNGDEPIYHQTNESIDFDDEDIAVSKSIVDKKLAMFFFSCSVPFRIVENKYFLDLVHTLCNLKFVYKPPCRQVLASSVLDDLHKDLQERKKELFENTKSVLLVDGWRNKSVNRKFLVCTLRNIHVSQMFLTFTDTSLEREDGQSLADNIERAIQIAKNEYKSDVFAVVTDNDSKIVCGGRLAQSTDNETLLQSTCSSHSANLLIKSFVNDDMTKKIKDIVNVFRDPKLESIINRLGGKKLKNFPDTRFCYLRDTCGSILKNLSFLQQACSIPDVNIPDDVFHNILDNEFINEVKEIVRNLDPICQLINKCQDPTYNIADATQFWLSLRLPTRNYDDIIRIRIEKAIWPVAYAANFLHHKYRGSLLNETKRNIASTFLKDNLDDPSFEELQLFLENRDHFSRISENCISPISFWTLYAIRFPNLSNFAIKLMLIPASTALIEGLFSQWTYVHNVYRNRLKNEKSAQLLDIYHSLKFIDLKYDEIPEPSKSYKRKRV